jgi:uncharacterized protein YciI
MKRLFTLLILLTGINSATIAQQSELPQLKTYYLVLLKTGPTRNQDSLTIQQLQKGHMAHLNKMFTEKKMCLAGPMGVKHDIRGICVYNVESLDEAVRFANEDPAVKAGRLVAEVIPWMSESGNCLP